MQQTFSDLSADFLFPKLHGMWARGLMGDQLLKAAQSGQTEVLGRLLAPAGIDINQRDQVQRDLTQRLISELARVMRLADRHVGAFYAAFIDRYFYENLKTVLHYHHFPDRDVSIHFLLIDSPDLPAFDAEAVLAANNVNQLFTALPDHPVKKKLLPTLVELDDTKDLFTAEGRLDQFYYESFQAAARGVQRGARLPATELVHTEIDIANLVTVMRNASLYQLPAERLAELCIQAGPLATERNLPALISASDQSLALELLPTRYQKVLRPLADEELYVSENALANVLYKAAYEAFTDYNRPKATVVAFPFLKRFETLNIGRVFEGLHFKLDAGEIISMLVGVGNV